MADCALCGGPGPRRDSHILPAFVFDYMKESSATGYIRFGTCPNRRVQDGIKLPLLCDDCEGKLSCWEKLFAERIFVPYHDPARLDQPCYHYEEWLAKFAVSVSWRSLQLHRHYGLPLGFPGQFNSRADEAEKTWREFLLGERPHPGAFEQHIVLFDTIVDADMRLPSNINRFLTRSPVVDIVFNSKSAFVFSKLCKVVVIGCIEMPTIKHWRGTKVRINYGRLPECRPFVDIRLQQYIAEKAKSLAALQASISDRQREKIKEASLTDADRTANSATFQALLDDIALSGEQPFLPDVAEGQESTSLSAEEARS
jgi:hypothetical protein